MSVLEERLTLFKKQKTFIFTICSFFWGFFFNKTEMP